MIEVSTSILSVKEEDSTKTFYNLETAKNRLFSYRCNGWKICRKQYK